MRRRMDHMILAMGILVCVGIEPALGASFGDRLGIYSAGSDAAGTRFGASVAIHGSVAAVGAPGDPNESHGAVHLIDLESGEAIDIYRAIPDERVSSLGAQAVAVDEDHVVASGVRDGRAYVYVFDRADGRMIYEFDGSVHPDSEFGSALDIAAFANGEKLLAVADPAEPVSADPGASEGVVYVFRLATGEQLARLPGFGDGFGSSLSFTPGHVGATGALLVGAPLDSTVSSQAGAAYLVNPTSGSVFQTFLPPGGNDARHDRFGSAVAIEGGGPLLVGAARADDLGEDSGKVIAFEPSSGAWQRTLLAGDGERGDGFGASIAIATHPHSPYCPGRTALIGAPEAGRSGAAYLFDLRTFEQMAKFEPSMAGSGADFGGSVALSETFAMIGAAKDSEDGSRSGSAHAFATRNPLIPHRIARFEEAGSRVALSRDFFALGAPLALSKHGRVDIYEFGDPPLWHESLAGGSAASEEFLGTSLAIDDAALAVSAHGFVDLYGLTATAPNSPVLIRRLAADDSPSGFQDPAVALSASRVFVLDPGSSVHVFDRVDGAFIESLTPPPGSGLAFGDSLAVSSSHLVVSSAGPGAGLISLRGEAFLFPLDSLQTSRILRPELLAGEVASRLDVAIEGEDVFVGADRADYAVLEGIVKTSHVGAVFRFDVASGAQVDRCWAPDPVEGDRFGHSIDVDRGVLLVGAPGRDERGADSGAVHLFDLWSAAAPRTIAPCGIAAGGEFGTDVAVAHGHALVSAPRADPGGVAHLLELPSPHGYDLWVRSTGLTGDSTMPSADPNHDGVANAAAYLHGAADPETGSADLLPQGTLDDRRGAFVVTYPVHRRALEFVHGLEFSLDLETFEPVESHPEAFALRREGVHGPAVDEMQIMISRFEQERLFTRLSIERVQ